MILFVLLERWTPAQFTQSLLAVASGGRKLSELGARHGGARPRRRRVERWAFL